MNNDPLSIRTLTKVMRRLKITDGDVVAILTSSPLAKDGNIDKLAEAIANLNMQKVVIVAVDNFDEIRVMNETAMRKFGWFKVEALRNVLHLKREGEKDERKGS